MEEGKKRKSEASTGSSNAKKSKPWRVPKKSQANYAAPNIEAGDAGIWATCEMGREGKCTAELRDMFEEYAAKLYGGPEGQIEREANDDEGECDIEADVKKEVQGMKSKTSKREALFQPVKVDIQCVLFFKTRKPVEPVDFVHRICQDALQGATKKHRWVKRLTPMTTMGKATVDGLEKVAQTVLQPVFHADDSPAWKFAIRLTRRNHNVLKRDEIIRQVASAVGPRHSVDLKNYDYLILVDVYRVSSIYTPDTSSWRETKVATLAYRESSV